MLSLIAVALLALLVLYAINIYRSFARNLAAAKASNIPYIIAPIYLFQNAWLVTHRIWMPYLRRLPQRWTNPWLDLIVPDWTWVHRHAPFRKIGSDTFMTVAPGGIVLWVADASAIHQITTRRNDFPKPIHMYRSIDLYGKNVVTTEGQIWRQHRKITSPPFTEKNNHLVWAESIHQAQAMLKSWVGDDSDAVKTIRKVADDTMRLSLHVISRAGFGVRLLWPGVEDGDPPVKGRDAQVPGGVAPSCVAVGRGHTMSYTDALSSLLHRLIAVLLLPKFLLKHIPFKVVRNAYESYVEWGKYMNEMYQDKKAEVAAGKEQEGMDLMGALVRGAGLNIDTLNRSPSPEKGQKPPKQALTDNEIIGNAFVFILAGHETTANAIHFSLIYLALNLSSQRHLQRDLDCIFHGRPTSEWDYERDIPKLFGGMTGAVLNEVLRLVPPVVNIPKSTLKGQPQTIILDGKKCVVPGGVMVNLISAVVHRNPRYWPTGPPTDPAHPIHPTSNTDNDLEEFRPERWLTESPPDHAKAANIVNGHAVDAQAAKPSDTDDLGVNAAPDTASTLYRPPKGAYIPFSEGYRACLGRRFAQVEVLAVLAVIFAHYSVELAVDEFAHDEEVEGMTAEERRAVWDKAERKSKVLLRDHMRSIITLQLRGCSVPLRFVKRGKERFDYAGAS
ncbi:cytochrome p450 [Lasallia pustulata]|uniref:Cytochrome p450 n=1 Tax=Lasallia pustulata TaxID=136370 RepID=A0A1W5DDZ0_9LECA|nr:cytochrome p450 [Lasallia pustulata]